VSHHCLGGPASLNPGMWHNGTHQPPASAAKRVGGMRLLGRRWS